MPRPFTSAQALENQAFLRELARTGNVRAAARAVGKAYATMQHRRARHPAFAQRWDAAMATAQGRLFKAGGERRPEVRRASRGDRPSTTAPSGAAPSTTGPRGPAVPLPRQAGEGLEGHRTLGGEPVVIRRKDGTFQVRFAQPGKLTRACEQAFLLALSATANVRLSAAAAGASEAAFYRRKRRNPAFAREWRAALEEGCRRIEMALLESYLPEAHEDDAWRRNDPPAVPPMTANQALQLLYLHQKEAVGWDEPPHLKRRRGEPHDMYRFRVARMQEARMEREREKFRVAAALQAARGDPSPFGPPIALPDLAQVTGWSKADPAKTPHDPARALFGGWRIEDMKRKPGRGGR